MFVLFLSGIFSKTPEPYIALCHIFVHPLFPVFEPHIQKCVVALVSVTLSVSNPFLLPGKKIDFGTNSLRADYDN